MDHLGEYILIKLYFTLYVFKCWYNEPAMIFPKKNVLYHFQKNSDAIF